MAAIRLKLPGDGEDRWDMEWKIANGGEILRRGE
jgi:hypothetical protein